MSPSPSKQSWAMIAICATAGVVVGSLLGRFDILTACILVAGAVGAILVFWKPLYGLLALLASTSFFSFRGHLPGLGIDSIHAPDLLLFFLFAATLFQIFYRQKKLILSPITLPLICFVGAAILSLYAGHLYKGVDFYGSFKEFKVVLYYLPALLIPNLVLERKELKVLVGGALGIGCLVAVYVAYLALTQSGNSEHSSFYALSSKTGGAEKMLLLWCTSILICLIAFERIRLGYLFLLGLTLAYFVLMFHRHMYLVLAMIGACGVIIIVRRGQAKWVRVLGTTGVVLLLGTALLAWGPSELRRYAGLTVERAVSIRGIESTSTVKARNFENAYAWKTIKQHPVIGLGFYTPYRPNLYGLNDSLHWFLHNGYLWILLKMGLLGFLPFAWLLARFFRRGWSYFNALEDPFMQAILASSILFVGGALFANFVAAYFMQDWGVLAFALAFGLNEAVYPMVVKRQSPNHEPSSS